ncbi:E9 [Duck papillomavirus 3]|uniref:E9 n=1 Tax=Duck papillomavirus 3 TaxID=2562546 RepID=A0AAE5YND3_9PAPI|nr:E9 [Duck papillomavirus 3]
MTEKTVRLVVEDWCALRILEENYPPLTPQNISESMCSLEFTVNDLQSCLNLCASAMPLFLQSNKDYMRIKVLKGALGPLVRRLGGRRNHPLVDEALAPLFDLCCLTTASLLLHIPFTKLEVYMPVRLLHELYALLAPSQQRLEKMLEKVKKDLGAAAEKRRRRHAARGRHSEKNYFNAA